MRDKVITRDDLDNIETLMGLMTKYKVSAVDINGLALRKDIHDPTEIPEPKNSNTDDITDDDLFYSSERD